MLGLGSKTVAIDLGTANTLIFIKDKGIVLREPSFVAQHKDSNESAAFGQEAYEMNGRTPKSITVIRPVKDGVIADYDSATLMVQRFLKEALKSSRASWKKTTVMICVPAGITSIEKQAITDAVRQSGAQETFTIEEPLAAAMGANLPVGEPLGSMVVDIGGGTTEVAVVSLNGIVTGESLKVGGQAMDQTVIQYIRNKYNVVIGERTGEMIKINIGSACVETAKVRKAIISVCGSDLLTGLPKRIEISGEEIARALQGPIVSIIESVKKTLEKTPPELAADVSERGIMLTGGGALLADMGKVVSNATGLPVMLAESPMDCVALGSGKALNSLKELRQLGLKK